MCLLMSADGYHYVVWGFGGVGNFNYSGLGIWGRRKFYLPSFGDLGA